MTARSFTASPRQRLASDLRYYARRLAAILPELIASLIFLAAVFLALPVLACILVS